MFKNHMLWDFIIPSAHLFESDLSAGRRLKIQKTKELMQVPTMQRRARRTIWKTMVSVSSDVVHIVRTGTADSEK